MKIVQKNYNFATEHKEEEEQILSNQTTKTRQCPHRAMQFVSSVQRGDEMITTERWYSQLCLNGWWGKRGDSCKKGR